MTENVSDAETHLLPMRTLLPLLVLVLLPLQPASAGEAYSGSVTVRTLLRTARTASGAPLSFPSAGGEVAAVDVAIPAGASTGWHVHDRSGFAYVLSGTLQVRLSDSTRNVYKAGDAFAEVVGIAHEGSALGSEPVHLVAFFSADSSRPISRKR